MSKRSKLEKRRAIAKTLMGANPKPKIGNIGNAPPTDGPEDKPTEALIKLGLSWPFIGSLFLAIGAGLWAKFGDSVTGNGLLIFGLCAGMFLIGHKIFNKRLWRYGLPAVLSVLVIGVSYLVARTVGSTARVITADTVHTNSPQRQPQPAWLPPELPSNCEEVTVFFGTKEMSMRINDARLPVDGSPVLVSDLPPELTNDAYARDYVRPWKTVNVMRLPWKVAIGEETLDFPILPYVKNNRLFVYVQMPFLGYAKIISMSTDMDSPLPRRWDRNFTSNAFEIVQQDGRPVLQVIYRRPNQVQVNGIFLVNTNRIYVSFSNAVPELNVPDFYELVGTQSVSVATTPAMNKILQMFMFDFNYTNQKAMFKYPAWKHLGQFAD